MSDEPNKPKLSDDQVSLVYEGRLNRAILSHLSITAAGIALAVVLYLCVRPVWLQVTLIILTIFAAGVGMRMVVLAVKCPSCGARVLGHVHSIVQVRGVKRCPECDIRLRG